MVKRLAIALCLLPLAAAAQEALLPLQSAPAAARRAAKQAGPLRLPFFDDFADCTVTSSLWEPHGGATATADVSPAAPTVGVATLDAIGSDGQLYASASTSTFRADTLCSLPIRLDSLAEVDSVVLSFHYMPGGGLGDLWRRVGDAPDAHDSLLLDFFRTADSSWINVWGRGGTCADTLVERTGSAWQRVAIALGSEWLDSAFRFRFRNLASLEPTAKAGRAGNCDYWHIDYVELDSGRSTADAGALRDVAFAAPAPRPLAAYSAMPYRHYSAASMADTMPLLITNLYSSPLATHYTYTVLDSAGTALHTYDGGSENAPPHWLDQVYQQASAHAAPPADFVFPAMDGPSVFRVVHTVRQGSDGDLHQRNDTVAYTQRFGHCYAYDDGTPENGYGITSTASQLYLACRFDVATDDTLTAVDLYFNPTADGGNGQIPFYITLWTAEEGEPGKVVYRDQSRRLASTTGTFVRHTLESPVVVGSGPLFVGFEQTGNNYINLGFDRSTDNSDKVYYLTGTGWQRSILAGSLMIRPCFGTAATLGATQAESAARTVVYPNPATSRIHVDGATRPTLLLLDSTGRTVASARGNTLEVDGLPQGLYLLRVADDDGPASTHRVIISH
ncbi:MAG: T9SS type A sorting domain-containing protein [Bacteroidales bacterium]|nr:T9SS type A sorting domain-containing protein [Bacteroidales bacterium]